MRNYFNSIVPAFTSFNNAKEQLVKEYRQQLKINELEPKVQGDTTSQMLKQLSSFNDHLEAIANAIKGER